MTAPRLKWSILKPCLLRALMASEWSRPADLLDAVYYDHGHEEPEYAHPTVWKLVDALRRDGYEIQAEIGRKSRGYRLVKQIDTDILRQMTLDTYVVAGFPGNAQT